MKKQFLSIVGMLTLLAVTTVAGYAQFIANLEAKIPFDFMVGESKLTAGKYTISPRHMPGRTLFIRGGKEKKALGFMVFEGARQNTNTKSQLVFRRYGNQYFLAEVSDGVSGATQKLIKSKAESEAAKSDNFANRTSEPEIVVVVAE